MKHPLLAIALSIVAFNINAEEVKIKDKDSDNKGKTETPIHVDLSNEILCISVSETIQAYVVVAGPDGVVYQRYITPKTIKTINIDLMQYQGGDYTITFYNSNGKVLEGEFVLSKLRF